MAGQRKFPPPHSKDQRELARALFLTGLTWPALVAATGIPLGTVRDWGRSEKWSELRRKAVNAAVNGSQNPTDRLSGAVVVSPNVSSQKARALAAEVAETGLSVLAASPPKTVKAWQARAKSTKTAIECAALAHGWDAQDGQRLVSVQVLAQVSSGAAGNGSGSVETPGTGSNGPAIDV